MTVVPIARITVEAHADKASDVVDGSLSMPLAGRLHRLFVSATSPCVAVLLVERMCVRPLIAGRDNQNGHLAPHQHRLSCLHEHRPMP